MYLSIYLSIHRSIYPSIYLSIYLSICKLENEAILRDFLSFWTWQHQKRSNSARLTTSKTKQFCETSSFFEVDNIKNEAILRDFLQEWKVECRADGLVPMRFAIFPFHLSKVLRLPRKSEARPYEVLHLSRKIIFLRKSAPGPPNISGKHVSCTAPATENASLQILLTCPMPAIVFGNATKPSRFAHLWQGAQSLAPATRNDIWTSKSGPNMWCFFSKNFDLTCASRRYGVHFFDASTSKSCCEPGGLCTIWLRNVLRARTACTCSTSQLPNAVRALCVLHILTSKYASRHNGVQFFISHLASWLRTGRFSEPTFRPSGATNHWKNIVFRDFPTHLDLLSFEAFFFFDLLSSSSSSVLFSDSSHLCFSCVHIVGSLTSKLPSNIYIHIYLYLDVLKKPTMILFEVSWSVIMLRFWPNHMENCQGSHPRLGAALTERRGGRVSMRYMELVVGGTVFWEIVLNATNSFLILRNIDSKPEDMS